MTYSIAVTAGVNSGIRLLLLLILAGAPSGRFPLAPGALARQRLRSGPGERPVAIPQTFAWTSRKARPHARYE